MADKYPKVVVVGAGAAGMMAAGQAAEAGAEVVVLEKMRRAGLKLAITGKGRCNLTNSAALADFIGHFGSNGRFLRQAFNVWFSDDLVDFFSAHGLELTRERGGRIFPAAGKAQQVVELLRRWLLAAGAEIHYRSAVERIVVEENRVVAVVSNGQHIRTDAVIVACGGSSYSATGSDGAGCALAAAVGHRIVPLRPALVPLVTTGAAAAQLCGLNLRNIAAALFVDGKKAAAEFGELVFNEDGVTGPVVLTMSGVAVDALAAGKQVELRLDLKPALDDKKLDARLQRDFRRRHAEELESILRGLMVREMVPVCLQQADLPGDCCGHSITVAQRKRLRHWLKNFVLPVSGHRPMDEAIVTAGGVDLKQVNPRSMESRLVSGLYFAGEVLDLQADTGGYNLQAAFSTGYLAGRSAAAIQEPVTDS